MSASAKYNLSRKTIGPSWHDRNLENNCQILSIPWQ